LAPDVAISAPAFKGNDMTDFGSNGGLTGGGGEGLTGGEGDDDLSGGGIGGGGLTGGGGSDLIAGEGDDDLNDGPEGWLDASDLLSTRFSLFGAAFGFMAASFPGAIVGALLGVPGGPVLMDLGDRGAREREHLNDAALRASGVTVQEREAIRDILGHDIQFDPTAPPIQGGGGVSDLPGSAGSDTLGSLQ
jgi:hypothetical protein